MVLLGVLLPTFRGVHFSLEGLLMVLVPEILLCTIFVVNLLFSLLPLLSEFQESKLGLLLRVRHVLVEASDSVLPFFDLFFEFDEVSLEFRLEDIGHLIPALLLLLFSLVLALDS
jgi:hypothetical protein